MQRRPCDGCDQRRHFPRLTAITEPPFFDMPQIDLHDFAMRYPAEYQAVAATLERQPFLRDILPDFLHVYHTLLDGFQTGKTLFLCGNGGSLADCLHLAGELLKTFKLTRPLSPAAKAAFAGHLHGDLLAEHLQRGLPCQVLGMNPALASAVLNDSPVPALHYAQELYCFGKPGDLLLGVSTSGNALNVQYAVTTAQALEMTVIGLTGHAGGKLAELADVALRVPATETYQIQEQHEVVYHLLCLLLELRFFL